MGRMLFLAILVGVGLLASSSYPTPTLSSAEAVTKQESPCQQLNLDTGLDYLNQAIRSLWLPSGIIKIAGSRSWQDASR